MVWRQEKNTAFVEIKLFENIDASASQRAMEKICRDINALFNIPENRIYASYSGGKA